MRYVTVFGLCSSLYKVWEGTLITIHSVKSSKVDNRVFYGRYRELLENGVYLASLVAEWYYFSEYDHLEVWIS